MRKTISVAALLLALTCPAYAGEMQNDKPAPPQAATAAQEPAGGGTATDETPEGTADILMRVTMELLAVLPSLL